MNLAVAERGAVCDDSGMLRSPFAFRGLVFVCLFVAAIAGGCSSCSAGSEFDDDGRGTAQGTGGTTFTANGGAGGGTGIQTCEQAAEARSYIGCDFWPTVTANNVWEIFDFAVVIANASTQVVEATVSRGGSDIETVTIEPNSLHTMYLPWVPELKGDPADACGNATPMSSTAKVANGAYHLVTSAPVTVYQFNALEYAPQGGPPGKSWDNCPGDQCPPIENGPVPCFSYSNDASLLLPSTSFTGNYRVMGWRAWNGVMGSFVAITGSQNGTNVTVTLSGTAQLMAGGGIAAAGPGSQASFTLDAGEVAELIGSDTSDFGGSLIQADKPVQVITGLPCVYIPEGFQACDHIEESVFPAETLGQHYFVTQPAGPEGAVVPHAVRIFGNVDGTNLSYPGGMPPGAPATINAGQVVELENVAGDFEISGDNAFAVGMYMLGAEIIDPGGVRGDPSQTFATAVEQFRTSYIFLAPHDYDVNFVQIIGPSAATITLDGGPITTAPQALSSGFSIWRVELGAGNNGSHTLIASEPVGIQVAGYGLNTTYYYPGGSDLLEIAPPPVE
jgi:hypothetical protein